MRQKRIRTALVFIILCSLFSITEVLSQSIASLNPPIARIELSRNEPVPPGVSETINWGGWGGGGGASLPRYNTPYWALYPDDIYNDMEACGYSTNALSKATLQLPSGTRKNLPRTINDGCWYYAIDWAYGMELGQYSILLNAPGGSLKNTWTITYPDTPTIVCLTREDEVGKLQALLMGFPPNKTITLRFYSRGAEYLDASNTYIASRYLKLDEHGATAIAVTVTKSSGFANRAIALTIGGFGSGEDAIAGPSCGSERFQYKHLNSPRISAEINNVKVDFDVTQNNQKGMLIHVAFDIHNFRGAVGGVNTYFYYANGDPLKDFDGKYNSDDGNVAIGRNFRAPYVNTTYSDFSLFMPYSQLHMDKGKFDLMFKTAIFDNIPSNISGFYSVDFNFNAN